MVFIGWLVFGFETEGVKVQGIIQGLVARTESMALLFYPQLWVSRKSAMTLALPRTATLCRKREFVGNDPGRGACRRKQTKSPFKGG